MVDKAQTKLYQTDGAEVLLLDLQVDLNAERFAPDCSKLPDMKRSKTVLHHDPY